MADYRHGAARPRTERRRRRGSRAICDEFDERNRRPIARASSPACSAPPPHRVDLARRAARASAPSSFDELVGAYTEARATASSKAAPT
jgi:hypothetical protein